LRLGSFDPSCGDPSAVCLVPGVSQEQHAQDQHDRERNSPKPQCQVHGEENAAEYEKNEEREPKHPGASSFRAED